MILRSKNTMAHLPVRRPRHVLPALALMCAAAFAAAPAGAEDIATFTLTLKADAFTPAEIKVPAGKDFMLKVTNEDASAAEIEAKDLKVEKVVAGHAEIVVKVRAVDPGRYLLVNEYKEDTVKAFVVAE